MEIDPQLGLALVIITGSFVSEDAAVLSAATLATTRLLDARLAFVSAIAGVSLGDYGLFLIARLASTGAVRWNWSRRLISSDAVAACKSWCERNARSSLFVSRAIPGTRLPVTLACGLFGMPASQFVLISLAGATAWVLLTFALVSHSHSAGEMPWVIFGIALPASIVVGRVVRRFVPTVIQAARRYRRWEFWPAWIFYIPVAFMYAWLAVRYRSLALPTLANPGQLNGGLVGESKVQILQELTAAAPAQVAEAFLIPAGMLRDRCAHISELLETDKLAFPFVLKPNIGQRGAGFHVVHDLDDAERYLERVAADVIAQRFSPGPCEVGIFYFRFPGDARGEILAITDKVFPAITGDGRSTLQELILADERASLIADTYLRRFSREHSAIVPAGTRIKLVEAGNHCQGCIFADGMHLYSEELRNVFDGISQSIPGFYIGRYDVRYSSVTDLQAGRFTIIELNGCASEATSIYDSRTSLRDAYRVLYRQWSLVFAIGDSNRSRGLRPPRPLSLWTAWREYARMSAAYPLAD
ncbi:MAG TPA: VTT domain-containing protein [Terriglobales bacterium]|nr:VTT domain-containing protein [Terriglobales bacterium]